MAKDGESMFIQRIIEMHMPSRKSGISCVEPAIDLSKKAVMNMLLERYIWKA
jgi:hypothetical protein